MPDSFDEALRRAAATRHTAAGIRRSVQDQRRRGAEMAAPVITQLLRDFSRTLHEQGVQPTRVELEPTYGQGWFSSRRRRRFSPDGYVLYWGLRGGGGVYRSCRLVTLDGQLWIFDEEAVFVPITAETLLNGKVWLKSRVEVGDDGEVFIDIGADGVVREPLEVGLADLAQHLISGQP